MKTIHLLQNKKLSRKNIVLFFEHKSLQVNLKGITSIICTTQITFAKLSLQNKRQVMNTRLPPTRNSIRNLSAEKIYEINHQQISPQKRTKFYFKLINMTAACFSILPLFTVLPNMRTPQQKILAYKKLLTYSRRLKQRI